jgi:hypothetical protein
MNYVLLIIFHFLLTSNLLMGQSLSASQIVQENVDFYNERDIEGFMSAFSDDIVIYNYSDFSISLKGKEEVRNFYSTLFRNSPELNSSIIKRIEFGNKVIDYEYIKGRNGSKDVTELVLIYELKETKIAKITVLRK